MIRHSLCALSLLAFSPQPAIPQTAQPLEAVPLVMCPRDNGYSAGTAFRIGPRLLLSVNHVTSEPNCKTDGQPIKVIYSHGDFSMISDSRDGKWLKVDCGGFVKGRFYVAIGHVRGSDSLTAVPMIALGINSDGFAMLAGIFTAQPGMSGGPIIDVLTNEVVGTVNVADWEDGTTGSTELKETAVCRHA